MRPILFDYAHAQKTSDFKEVVYDYEDDLSKIDGKTVVERSQAHTSYLTKTKVQRESDDSPLNELIELVTKTAVKRESDDTGMDPYITLLTKTEVVRESDE